jgi:hypothetical protein
MLGTIGYGGWRYKTKGFKFNASLFLMQLRVGAQSVVVGCITVGLLYNMYLKPIVSDKKED